MPFVNSQVRRVVMSRAQPQKGALGRVQHAKFQKWIITCSVLKIQWLKNFGFYQTCLAQIVKIRFIATKMQAVKTSSRRSIITTSHRSVHGTPGPPGHLQPETSRWHREWPQFPNQRFVGTASHRLADTYGWLLTKSRYWHY